MVACKTETKRPTDRTLKPEANIATYKWVERLVPAVDPNEYFKGARPKRIITAKQFDTYQTINVVIK